MTVGGKRSPLRASHVHLLKKTSDGGVESYTLIPNKPVWLAAGSLQRAVHFLKPVDGLDLSQPSTPNLKPFTTNPKPFYLNPEPEPKHSG